MKLQKYILFALTLSLVISSSVSAYYRTWNISEVDTEYGLLVMGSNGHAPMIAGTDGVYVQTPAGYMKAYSSAPFQYEPIASSYTTDVVSGPNGEFAFLHGSSRLSHGQGRVTQYKDGRFSSFDATGITGIAYDNRGNLNGLNGGFDQGSGLCVYNGNRWVQDQTLNVHGYKLLIDSYNNRIIFDFQNVEFGAIQAAISGNDMVAAIGMSPDAHESLSIGYYDVQTGSWISNVLASDYGPWNNAYAADIAFDSEGNIGAAYILQDRVYYAFSTEYGFVVDEIYEFNDFQGAIYSSDSVLSLAFDADDNPVLAIGNNDRTYIAYDPIVVPEPATLAILSLGGLLMRARMKRS